MKNKTISIITDYGTKYGTGHIQRMLNLLNTVNQENEFRAFIVNKKKIPGLPQTLSEFIIPDIKKNSDLIIYDKRDSTVTEINNLQRISKVLVIDDLGPGRDRADFSLDLLPNIKNKNLILELKNNFLFGYNFTESIKNLGNCIINKSIDFAFYPGFKANNSFVKKVLTLFPENSTIVLLLGDKFRMIKNGNILENSKKSYAELILSSKTVITHFGITLFEGEISKCNIITINPTQYHSTLTDLTKKYITITSLGEFQNMDFTGAKDILKKNFLNQKKNNVNPELIYNKIMKNITNFTDYLKKII